MKESSIMAIKLRFNMQITFFFFSENIDKNSDTVTLYFTIIACVSALRRILHSL